MYSICNVVVGTPVPHRISNFQQEVDFDPADIGFKMLYSGNADTQPGYCGVKLCSFDECDTQKVSNLKLVPNEEQIEKATEMLAQARVKLQEWFGENDPDGEWDEDERNYIISSIPLKPDVYLVWSTS